MRSQGSMKGQVLGSDLSEKSKSFVQITDAFSADKTAADENIPGICHEKDGSFFMGGN